jgi:hypothetical protein
MKDERWLRLVLASLATWRLTHLLAYEDGPQDAVAVLRRRLGAGFFGSLMDCFQCLSLWTAAPLAYWAVRDRRHLPMACLAISGAACLLENASSGPVIMQPAPTTEH